MKRINVALTRTMQLLLTCLCLVTGACLPSVDGSTSQSKDEASASERSGTHARRVPGRVVVQLVEAYSKADASDFRSMLNVDGYEPVRVYRLIPEEALSLAAASTPRRSEDELRPEVSPSNLNQLLVAEYNCSEAETEGIALALAARPYVEDAEADLWYKGPGSLDVRGYGPRSHRLSLPADPEVQWGIDTIRAPLAWEFSTGAGATVAVVDTGVDYTHPDLVDNIARWPSGAVKGFDFADSDIDPMPEEGCEHGTHVAGIIAAARNGSGVVGVAPDAKIIPLRVGRCDGVSASSVAAAIYIAIYLGADVINLSISGGRNHSVKRRAVAFAERAGIPIVTIAGNGKLPLVNFDYGIPLPVLDDDTHGWDIDREDPVYPASFGSDSIIAVASHNKKHVLAQYSNYGKESVDLAAPGTKIFSTVPGNGYDAMAGTSQAAPHVAGAFAVLKAFYPNETMNELKQRLLENAHLIYSAQYKLVSRGRLDLFAALDNAPPHVDIYRPGRRETVSGVVRVDAYIPDNVSRNPRIGSHLGLKSNNYLILGRVPGTEEVLFVANGDMQATSVADFYYAEFDTRIATHSADPRLRELEVVDFHVFAKDHAGNLGHGVWPINIE